MSERSAALGIKGPPKTIEHKGKVYTIAPVLTEGTMLRIENHLYARARDALVALRSDYPEAEYVARLDALRKRREAGEFAFERVQDQLTSLDGAALVLGCMMDATQNEIYELLLAKPDEVFEAYHEITADSFPQVPNAPKAKALPGKGKAKWPRR